jgi:hypothetical protein
MSSDWNAAALGFDKAFKIAAVAVNLELDDPPS